MKLLFSEAKPDYGNYIFPYAIWAFPEPGEKPSDFFARGFLPSSYALERFYLCRQIRVNLRGFALNSENRRIIRKGQGIECALIRREDFQFTEMRREFCRMYTEAKFGVNAMSAERLETLFASNIVSHVLVFTDMATSSEVGLVVLYLEHPTTAFYYYAFYNLDYRARNLGMFMMTSAVAKFAEMGMDFAYVGTCYSTPALYKFQFNGAEFFNGFAWSPNEKELRYLIERDQQSTSCHLLETLLYRETYWSPNLERLAEKSSFRIG